MSWSSAKRRWPEAALLVVLLIVAMLSGLAARVAAGAIAAAILVFAVRRRVRDVIAAAGLALLLLALAVAATLTVDVGTAFDGALRKLAESRGSEYLHRPMHIGRLSIHLATGR